MRFRISDAFSQRERSEIASLINSAYPSSTVLESAGSGQDCTVADADTVMRSHSSSVPMITPLVVRQKIESKISDLSFPTHGLINLHLYNKRICFSGFSTAEKHALREMAIKMGAIIDRFLSPSTQILISSSLQTRHSQFSISKSIPIASSSYIYSLSTSPDFLPIESFKLPLFAGCFFSVADMAPEQVASIRSKVTSNGATFSEHFSTKTTHLIIPEGSTSNRVAVAVDYGIPLISPEQIDAALASNSVPEPLVPPLVVSSLFEDKRFSVDASIESKVSLLIRQNGGKIVSDSNCDFSIECLGPQPRTIAWLERCVEASEVLSVEEFPIFVFSKSKHVDLGRSTVCLSGIAGKAFLNYCSAIRWLGAKISLRLTRKCSMLISEKGGGKKVNAAMEWGIPIYASKWIEAIARGESGEDLKKYQIYVPPLKSPAKSPAKSPIKVLAKSPGRSPQRVIHFLQSSDSDDEIEQKKAETKIASSNKEQSFLSDSDDDAKAKKDISFLSDDSDDTTQKSTDSNHSSGSSDKLKDICQSIKAFKRVPRKKSKPKKAPSMNDLLVFTQIEQKDPEANESSEVVYENHPEKPDAPQPGADPLMSELENFITAPS